METIKLRLMGRRRFLRSLQAAGLSAATLSGLSQETVANMLEDNKYPHVKALRHTNHEAVVQDGATPTRKKVHESIPREEWIQYRTAQRARQKANRIVAQYNQVEAAIGLRSRTRQTPEIEITVSHTTVADEQRTSKPAITVDELADQLPSTVTGTVGERAEATSREFSVNIQKQRQQPQGFYNSEYRPIPGGCQTERGDFALGTLACVAHDDDIQARVMLSAGHVVNGSATPSEHHQHSATFSKQFGESEDYVASTPDLKDFGSIQFVNFEPSFDLADSSGSYKGRTLMGVLTHDQLDRMMTNLQPLSLQGRASGESLAYIDFVDQTTVQLSTSTKSGDSGGPYYKKEGTDEYYMAGIHAWGVDNDEDTEIDAARGNKITVVENQLNVTV